MVLAAIEDAAEGAFLRRHITAASRIGLADVEQTGVWRWTMTNALSTCSEPFPPSSTNYTNWASGEPRQAARSDGTVSDAGRCAWLGATKSATWTAGDCHTPLGYICEALPRDGSHALRFNQIAAELEEARLERGAQQGRPEVSPAKLSARADFAQLFNREQARFGLRPCLDSLVHARTWTFPDMQRTICRQYYKGLPVAGAGYDVLRDGATGEVRKLTSNVAYKLEISTEVRVGREIALMTAVASIGGQLSNYDSGLGTLYVYPVSEHPRVIYELAWQFELPAVGGLDAYNVVISALDGRMIHRLSLFEQ